MLQANRATLTRPGKHRVRGQKALPKNRLFVQQLGSGIKHVGIKHAGMMQVTLVGIQCLEKNVVVCVGYVSGCVERSYHYTHL